MIKINNWSLFNYKLSIKQV